MNYIIKPKDKLSGVFTVASDKSLSHRSVIFSSISNGITEIEGFLTGDDCISTINCFRELGIKIEQKDDKVKVFGNGMRGLKKPNKIIDIGNSGTSIRLITGLLAGQNFDCEITGDSSIQKRPMDRIITPLRLMNANITGKDDTTLAPLKIKGTQLTGMEYTLPIASAQIKSAILLASLYANSETIIHEPIKSRDHTEIMLNYFGADIKIEKGVIYSKPIDELTAKKIIIPGDISSAAYFIVAALICKNSHIIITNVGVNFTRTGILSALKEMGGNITILNERESCGELIADIEVYSSDLKATTISGDIIPRMIDEIPVFAVAALFAKGTTVIKDAAELKVKESNRINAIATELCKMGANIQETDDGMIIQGDACLHGAEVLTYNDHRIAMSLAIAGIVSSGETNILDSDCVAISFPNFFEYIENL